MLQLQHFGVRISVLVHHTDNSSVDLRTVADFTGSSSTTINRKTEDKCDTDEKRSHTSSDDLFTSAPSQHYQPSVRADPDSFAPPAFTGANIDDGNWLVHFRRYAEYRQPSDQDSASIFPLFLKDSAIDMSSTHRRALKNAEIELAHARSYIRELMTSIEFVTAERASLESALAVLKTRGREDGNRISRWHLEIGRLRYELRRALHRRRENCHVDGPLRTNIGEQSSRSSTVAAIQAKLTDAEADLAAAQLEECDF